MEKRSFIVSREFDNIDEIFCVLELGSPVIAAIDEFGQEIDFPVNDFTIPGYRYSFVSPDSVDYYDMVEIFCTQALENIKDNTDKNSRLLDILMGAR
jgi:hypothetical protein